MTRYGLAALLASTMLAAPALVAPALAQTPVGGPPIPTQQGQMQASPPAPPAAPMVGSMPVPDSVVWQAENQNEGWYGPMRRARTSGQVQDVWSTAAEGDAAFVYDWCPDCTYKVRVREYMVSLIEFPRGEVIEAVDLGDDSGFAIRQRGPNRLAVRPVSHGYDTSMLVYGASGRVYPVYLRAEGFNSSNVPDLVVRIVGPVPSAGGPVLAGYTWGSERGEGGGGVRGREDVAPLAVPPLSDRVLSDLTPPASASGDFVQEAPFDPDALRGWGDYRLWGDTSLRPETVFRDDRFTYIRFGDRWNDVELPTAYVVVDGIDELVNTRVQGTTFIIESTNRLITLKSGNTYLCIEYRGGA